MKNASIFALLLALFMLPSGSNGYPFSQDNCSKKKKVTRAQVNNFARKKLHINPSVLLYFDSIALDTVKRIPFKPHLGNSFPRFRMFDCRTLAEITAWQASEGPLDVYHVWDTFPPRNLHPLLPGSSLPQCTAYLRTGTYGSCQPAVEGYDYVVLAYWSVQQPMATRLMAKDLCKYIRAHSGKRIQVLYVNVDRIG